MRCESTSAGRVLGPITFAVSVLLAGGLPSPSEGAPRPGRPEVVLAGTVFDAADQPVGGVEVAAVGWNESKQATTTADGRFQITLETTPAGQIYTVLLARAVDGRLGLLRVLQEK